jgi:hypothetical protein
MQQKTGQSEQLILMYTEYMIPNMIISISKSSTLAVIIPLNEAGQELQKDGVLLQ